MSRIMIDIAMASDQARESSKNLIQGIGDLLARDAENITVASMLSAMTFMVCEVCIHAGISKEELLAVIGSGYEASNHGHSDDHATMN